MRMRSVIVLWLVVGGVVLAVTSVLASYAEHGQPGGACKAGEEGRACAGFDKAEAVDGGLSHTQAITIQVPADHPTIQGAIDAAGYGDTVLVAVGTYTEHVSVTSGIALVCDDAARGCVITEDDPPSLDSALVTCENCDAQTLIQGFTIQGANGHEDAYGYGLTLTNSDVRILNNAIVDNYRSVWQGTYLTAYRGQGILIQGGGKPRIVGNLLSNNRTYRFGGGVAVQDGAGAVIIHNIFKWNYVFNWGPDCDGGGLAIGTSDVFVSNNVFDGNTAKGNHERGGGIFIAPGASPQYVGNNIFLNNKPYAVQSDHYGSLSYSLVHENPLDVPDVGAGMVYTDPLFIDPAGLDYHLDEGSPAIDSGDPRPYFNDPEDPGNPGQALYPALGGLRNDMGAYGGTEAGLVILADPNPLSGVALQGPTQGPVLAGHTFTATVAPLTATLPVTYVWQAGGQETIARTGGLSDVVTLSWPTAGLKTVTVTATNAAGSVAGSHNISILVPPAGVIITGTKRGIPGVTYTFEATVQPVSTTLPITYAWQASGHGPVTHTAGLSDELALAWPITGDKRITVTAGNAVSQVVDSYTLSIVAAEHRIHLPLISKAPVSWAENHSYPTTCAEEDNINVPIFAPVSSTLSITATHPTYEIGIDNCDADFSGCAMNLIMSNISSDVCTDLDSDGVYTVQGCTVEGWWRPYAMQITVGSVSAEYHYLVLYKKIEGDTSGPQFLVLYEDGNMRLKPHPQVGQADLCFGSSVIVGPVVAATSIRPYVDIQEVEVDLASESLDVAYRDGGSAQIGFSVDRTEAVAVVEAEYDHSHTEPLAAFRSMFVADGNADVDHVTGGAGSYAIMGGWVSLAGPDWHFTRMTRSQHNTSAPDIRVGVVE